MTLPIGWYCSQSVWWFPDNLSVVATLIRCWTIFISFFAKVVDLRWWLLLVPQIVATFSIQLNLIGFFKNWFLSTHMNSSFAILHLSVLDCHRLPNCNEIRSDSHNNLDFNFLRLIICGNTGRWLEVGRYYPDNWLLILRRGRLCWMHLFLFLIRDGNIRIWVLRICSCRFIQFMYKKADKIRKIKICTFVRKCNCCGMVADSNWKLY